MSLSHLKTDPVNSCRTCSKTITTIYFDLYQEIPVEQGPKKTYYKLLNELLNINTLVDKDVIKAKKLCKRCGTFLKNIYLFILEAQRLQEEYLLQVYKNNVDKVKTEDVEDAENIMLPSTSIVEIKVEKCPVKAVNTYNIANNENPIRLMESIKVESMSHMNVENVRKDSALDNVDESSNSDDADKEHDKCSKNSYEISDRDLAVRCDLCNKVYKNRKILTKHKYYTHMSEEQKLRCKLCEFKTSRMSCLKMHMNTMHGAETVEKYIQPKYKPIQKYSCNKCEKKYCRKEDLRRHIREKHKLTLSLQKSEHSKPRDFYLCDFCGQSFTTLDSLRRHSKIHSDDRPYKCYLCAKAFRRQQDLKSHIVIHRDDKPHQCVKCGKSFKRPDKLRTHMIVHSELRPYKCKECTKTFKYASALKTHMHIHTGEKPFKCKTCNENFSLRTTLNAHCLKNGHLK